MVTPSSRELGATMVEAIVALLVGLLVLQLGLSTLARLRSAQATLSSRADALVALRIGRHVLRQELRHGVPARDWIADADSVSLRAFRGTGLVCGSDSLTASVEVTYAGQRAPDPTKDSVLLVTADGLQTVYALVGAGATTSACAGGVPAPPSRWRLDRPAPPDVVVARLFERGAYHLSGAALRYRRGASGRQPLTPEVWSALTGWTASTQSLGVRLVPSPGRGAPWSGFLAWQLPE
ncbi:MAG: hypothetical protein ABL963_15375 [Longimicrobiales bacterium]